MYNYQDEMYFSMHTFEIRARIGSEDYYSAYNQMKWYCKKYKKSMYEVGKKNEGEFVIADTVDNTDVNYELYNSPYDYIDDIPVTAIKQEVICEALTDRGIIMKFVRCKLGDSPIYYGIWLIINPRRFLGDNSYVGIFDPRRADELLDKLHWKFIEIGMGNIPLYYYRLHRIDLCRNTFLDSQSTVESSLELMKKCYVPSGYTWNEIGGTEYGVRLKDGIKIANGSLAIVAYNKAKQMSKQDGYFSPEAITEAEGLLRFEIQLFTGRINYLCKLDNALYNLKHFLQSCESLNMKHFEQYIPKIFLRGNYYTLDIAKKIVMDSNYHEATKKYMLTLLQNVSIYGNLMTAIDKTCKKFKPVNLYNFKRDLLRHFDNLQLNPVTIPRRWEEAEFGFLPGAYNRSMGIETLFVSAVD